MIVIGGMLLGAVLGAVRARQLGGKPADQAQYAAGYGILLAIVGLFLTVAIDRLAV